MARICRTIVGMAAASRRTAGQSGIAVWVWIRCPAVGVREMVRGAFFVMVQLPCLQPFDDVNTVVSRLSANIPLIKANGSPLSFEDVPRDTNTEAVLGVYELNRIELLRDVFTWAYERSAARYAAVRQSLGEPDPFRMRHRTALREVVGAVVRERMDKKQAAAHVNTWTHEHLDQQGRERFREIAERELLSLHEGNFARYWNQSVRVCGVAGSRVQVNFTAVSRGAPRGPPMRISCRRRREPILVSVNEASRTA